MSNDRLEDFMKKLLDEHRAESNLHFQTLTAITENISNKLDAVADTNTRYNERVDELVTKTAWIERGVKKNNIIIYGIPEVPAGEPSDVTTLVQMTLKTLNDKLDTQFSVNDINNIYRIGKGVKDKPRPILLQFVSFLKKILIYSNIRNLKGTGISISNDMTREDAQMKKELMVYLRQAREKKYLVKFKGNTLEINGDQYSLSQLRLGALENSVKSLPNVTAQTAEHNISIGQDNTTPVSTDSQKSAFGEKRQATSPISLRNQPKRLLKGTSKPSTSRPQGLRKKNVDENK